VITGRCIYARPGGARLLGRGAGHDVGKNVDLSTITIVLDFHGSSRELMLSATVANPQTILAVAVALVPKC